MTTTKKDRLSGRAAPSRLACEAVLVARAYARRPMGGAAERVDRGVAGQRGGRA
jgi:hypothetical protein